MVLFEQRALLILYNAILSVGKRDVYLIPANVCPIIPAAFLKAGAAFRLVDVDAETLCIDEASVLAELRGAPDRSFGVLYVRTYGVERSPGGFFAAIRAARPDTFLVDDKCLCRPEFDPASDSGPDSVRPDLVLYSTGYSKFAELGWGGFGFLNADPYRYRRQSLPYQAADHDALVHDMNEAIKNDAPFRPVESDWLGDFSFQGDFAAYREETEKARAQAESHKAILNGFYAGNLPAAIQMRPELQVWRFSILVPDKRRLLENIFRAGHFASSHYAPLARVYASGNDTIARSVHARTVNLFNDFRFDPARAAAVCEIIHAHLRNTPA